MHRHLTDAQLCAAPVRSAAAAAAVAALLALQDGAHALPARVEGGRGVLGPLAASGRPDSRQVRTVRHSGPLATSLHAPALRLCGGCAKRQATGVELLVIVVVWYTLNVGWNLSNKNLCNLLKLPLTASALQMTLGSCFMMMQWVFKTRKVAP